MVPAQSRPGPASRGARSTAPGEGVLNKNPSLALSGEKKSLFIFGKKSATRPPSRKKQAFLFGGGQIPDRNFRRKKCGLGQGLPASPWPGPSPAQNVDPGPNHQKWLELGPESTARPENRSRSMPGPLRSVSDRSRDEKKIKKPGQAAPR